MGIWWMWFKWSVWDSFSFTNVITASRGQRSLLILIISEFPLSLSSINKCPCDVRIKFRWTRILSPSPPLRGSKTVFHSSCLRRTISSVEMTGCSRLGTCSLSEGLLPSSISSSGRGRETGRGWNMQSVAWVGLQRVKELARNNNNTNDQLALSSWCAGEKNGVMNVTPTYGH